MTGLWLASGSEGREVSPQEFAGWRSVTAGTFRIMLFEGDHFYLHDARTGFMEAVRRELALVAPR
jgi:surfactin synthase thioesterase subunit